MKYAMGVSASIIVSAGLLAAQFLNMPVEIPAVDHAFGEADLIRMRDAEKEHERYLRNIAAAQEILFPFNCGEKVAASIVAVADSVHLSPRIVASTIVVESSCQPAVVSKDGAVGLMQVDRHTWKQYTREELMQPDRNIEIGARILAANIRQTGSTREGLRKYFGVTAGSTASDEYADKILGIAARRN